MPSDPVVNKKVEYINFPYPFLTIKDIQGYDNHQSGETYSEWVENSMDQGRRVMFGTNEAKKHGCTYVMSIDADDLISKDLVSFVLKQPTVKSGWYVNKGYVYNEGEVFLYKCNKDFNHINGSVNIVNAMYIPNPDFSSGNIQNFNLFSSHAWLKVRMKDFTGDELLPLPFYAVIYSRNGINWTTNSKYVRFKYLKQFIKIIFFGKLVTPNIRNQFSLYSIKI
jgi:hypothetical protein